jgi:sulfotransferase
MKYPHRRFERLGSSTRHEIPPRIQAHIEKACGWYYNVYYPNFITRPAG